MGTRSTQRASHQRSRAGLALSIGVALAVLVTLGRGYAVSADPLLLPLDDAYIHFQYARQWADGQPMAYYNGAAATSGGTSLLYPPLLALGWLLGFTGWKLAYWALALGVLSLGASSWLVYLVGLRSPLPSEPRHAHHYALCLAIAFAIGGPFVWAALSGMETMPFVWAVLLTGFAVQRGRLKLAVAAAVLMPLLRPEGAILGALAAAVLALTRPWPATLGRRLYRAGWLALPLLAALVQPLVNLWTTGGATSSGMQAKSHLFNVGASPGQRAWDILAAFGRIWQELLLGRSADFGVFVSPLLGAAALAGLGAGALIAWRRRRANFALLVLLWIGALTAAVATLDTAFWQFKRYQLPVMALFFPAAAWAAAGLGERLRLASARRWLPWALPALILFPAPLTTLTFAYNYAINVEVVRDQQLPMARWVRDHLPPDARIGVHDVGLMAYFADRPLYDVVGLTTRGPALSWRQGPGAIFEHMAHSAARPDYFAIYPDVQGLRYLLGAGVFGEVLAEFAIDLPTRNVAAATDYQAVYAADWTATRPAEHIAQTTTLGAVTGMQLVDQVDVAELNGEAAHAYERWQTGTLPGFMTEVYRHIYHACGLPAEAECWATDGGRVLTGGEAFTLRTRPGEDMVLVTRVHGRQSVGLNVYAGGEFVARRVQPAVPGRWLEVATLIPAAQITGAATRIRIEADGDGSGDAAYLPYYHWAYQGRYTPDETDATARATFGPSGEIQLLDYMVEQEPQALTVTLVWRGPAPSAGDGVVFVHLYNTNQRDIEPLAQDVARPGGGVLPPANWLPGTIQDHHTVPLPQGLPSGRYAVAVGLYDHVTGERYPVMGEGASLDGRLWIGEVTLEELAQ